MFSFRMGRNSRHSIGTESTISRPLLSTDHGQTQPPTLKTLGKAFLWFSILSASAVACMNSFAATINNVYGQDFTVEEPDEYFPYYKSGWGILLLICPLSSFIANIASGYIFTEDAVKASLNVLKAAAGRFSNVRELTNTIQEPPMSQSLAISALIGGLFTACTYTVLSIDAFQYLLTLSKKNKALHITLFILYVFLILCSTFISTSSRISGVKSFLTRAPLGISYLYLDLYLDKEELKIYSSIRILLQNIRDMKDLIPYLKQDEQKILANLLKEHRYNLAIAYFKENKPTRSQAWVLFLKCNNLTLWMMALLTGPLFYTIGDQFRKLVHGCPSLSKSIAILSTPFHVLMYLVILPRAIRSIPTFYQYMKNLHSTKHATIIMSCITLISACSYGGLAYSAHHNAKKGEFHPIFPFLNESILTPTFTVIGGATTSIINLFCLMTFSLDRLSRNIVNDIHDDNQNNVITKKEIDSLMKEIENLGLHAVNNTTDYNNEEIVFSDENMRPFKNMRTLFSDFTVEKQTSYQDQLQEEQTERLSCSF